jgi:proline iminopeptidase
MAQAPGHGDRRQRSPVIEGFIAVYINVNGARLYFDVEGSALIPDGSVMREKPTMILVHGGPGMDHSHYKPAFSKLSDVAQLIYYDHRGNGRSESCHEATWNLAQWGDDLRGLCDALGIQKPIVLGASFGGFVAQSYVTRHPDHPSKLILISTAAKMDFQAVYRAFERLGGKEVRDIAETYWENPTAQMRAKYRDRCAPFYQVNKEGMRDLFSRALAKDDTALWFNGPKNEQGRMDFRDQLMKIVCPVLVLAGKLDPITPPEFSDVIASSINHDLVTLRKFSDCGHGVVADRPDAAFEAIRNFILSA